MSSPYSQSSTPSEWRSARATYYGDLEKAGYGKATSGLSMVLFEKGQICGACFEVKCVDDLWWCIPGTSIIVTAKNFYAPNYGFPNYVCSDSRIFGGYVKICWCVFENLTKNENCWWVYENLSF
ncbi:putative expansin/pollen allergen, DPBB domain, expansin/Lol pI, RlpA-like domain superfamily [Helianthus anomalus]